MVSRAQLFAAGLTPKAIEHRLASGRLHYLFPGVYAVGRPEVSEKGLWMAAVLAAGPEAVISHADALALLGILPKRDGHPIELSIPPDAGRRRCPPLKLHRRVLLPHEVGECDRIPVTSPAVAIVDLAARHHGDRLDRAISEADRLGLVTEDALRNALEQMPRRPGKKQLREKLDPRTFRMTRSKLERWFLPLGEAAGLGLAETAVELNGFEVDFLFRDIRLIVEADSLTYHRTSVTQARDRLRDQTHARAGYYTLRFTHHQIRYQPDYVIRTLRDVAGRLQAAA